MGSSGSGKFGTYRVGNSQATGGTGTGSGGTNIGAGGGIGGGAGEIECPSVIENIRLEDVATSAYYIRHQSLPAPGEPVDLNNVIYKGRLVVNSTSTSEVLGNLPTQYNHLINCIKKGMQYTGTVVASGLTPIPFVVVTLNA